MSENKLETNIQEQLNIKWVAARDLARRAQTKLGIADADLNKRENEVLSQALKMYRKLSAKEKREIALLEQAKSSEPAWRRKARQQAERRERHWKQEAEERRRQEAIERGEDASDFVFVGPHKITKITRTIQEDGRTRVVEEVNGEKIERENIKVTRYTCAMM